MLPAASRPTVRPNHSLSIRIARIGSDITPRRIWPTTKISGTALVGRRSAASSKPRVLRLLKEERDRRGRGHEAARLTLDLYTDWARGNGLRVASLDTLELFPNVTPDGFQTLYSAICRKLAEVPQFRDDEEDRDEGKTTEAPKTTTAGTRMTRRVMIARRTTTPIPTRTTTGMTPTTIPTETQR